MARGGYVRTFYGPKTCSYGQRKKCPFKACGGGWIIQSRFHRCTVYLRIPVK